MPPPLLGIKKQNQYPVKAQHHEVANQVISTRTKICLFLASNPAIFFGLSFAIGITLPFSWPVVLLLTGVCSVIFLGFAGASANLDLDSVIMSTVPQPEKYSPNELRNRRSEFAKRIEKQFPKNENISEKNSLINKEEDGFILTSDDNIEPDNKSNNPNAAALNFEGIKPIAANHLEALAETLEKENPSTNLKCLTRTDTQSIDNLSNALEESKHTQLIIIPICIKGTGNPGSFVANYAIGEPTPIENHVGTFFVDQKNETIEYYDPKAYSLHNGLISLVGAQGSDMSGPKLVEIKEKIQNKFPKFKFFENAKRVQDLRNTTDCGIHAAIRMDEYAKTLFSSASPQENDQDAIIDFFRNSL